MANIVAIHPYAGCPSEVANRIKNSSDDSALQQAAVEMAEHVPDDVALVPAPSSSGRNKAMLVLAEYISDLINDAVVVEAVRRVTVMPSKVLLRRAGKPLPSLDDQVKSMRLALKIPDARDIWIVDNVVTSGDTIRAMESVIGRPINAVVYAQAGRGRRNPRRHQEFYREIRQGR